MAPRHGFEPRYRPSKGRVLPPDERGISGRGLEPLTKPLSGTFATAIRLPTWPTAWLRPQQDNTMTRAALQFVINTVLLAIGMFALVRWMERS